MLTAAAVLLVLAAPQAAPEKPIDPAQGKAEDRRLITVREFVVKVEAKEAVSYKALWVSRDGGRTWKAAREAGITESWGDWAAGTGMRRLAARGQRLGGFSRPSFALIVGGVIG